jgi:hypothetical protein
MNLKEVLSISGMPGLYKMVANRDNGLIVTALGDDKKKFVSSRQHMFTPLENITIYTEEDSEELVNVLKMMKEKSSEIPLVKPNASSKDLRAYFTKVIPNHDQEKVYTSDIKKLLKWYDSLEKEGLLVFEVPEEKKPAKKTTKKTEKTATEEKKKPTKSKSTKKTTKKKSE